LIFDWRQLHRFGLRESALPPGSTVKFRVPSVWELYRKWIIGSITLILFQTIQLLAEGRSMKEIADILTISLRTVAAHKYRVMDFLEIKTNAEVYRYAVKHQIISV
jgi:DNA-binding CsgD family transcriptional regulator